MENSADNPITRVQVAAEARTKTGLRNYFAGQALVALGADQSYELWSTLAKDTARWAFNIADAMVAEAEKRQ